jgi:hypothetical protein
MSFQQAAENLKVKSFRKNVALFNWTNKMKDYLADTRHSLARRKPSIAKVAD